MGTPVVTEKYSGSLPFLPPTQAKEFPYSYGSYDHTVELQLNTVISSSSYRLLHLQHIRQLFEQIRANVFYLTFFYSFYFFTCLIELSN